MTNLSVLYDAPGPRAKRRNALYAVLFVAVLGAFFWWVVRAMNDKNQLDAEKWDVFVTDSRIWTTFLWPGLQDTLIAAGLSLVIALPLGVVFGIGRLSDHWWIRRPCDVIVEFFRAVPVLLMMIFANQAYALWSDVDRDVRPLYAVVTGLVLYNASVLAEIVRAGVLTLPRGQGEAARAIGLRKGQTMVHVLLPQAVTAMLPAIVSQLVVIVKDTTLGGAMLGYSELLSNARLVSTNYANTIAAYTVAAILFIALNFLLTSLASWLENRLRRGKRGTGVVVKNDPTDPADSTSMASAIPTPQVSEPQLAAPAGVAAPGKPGTDPTP
ncbi:amino acid ABC transporter permease [Streptomyces millisiae]|uniref:Amino acid ABC transporter permease n=1 Tax=Streptomyces millisiae TaxID=3075542 RepID=A0ABU2LSS9_9ACTN|nr:amino acid ABC transporter permease [Streptomyces sp. DSM 44918]MDT0320642.1 amino acid ABC transporter permease [Streptomyces sp. DSM 44918]